MFAPSELAGALTGIALISGVGRVALSWLPAGPTGSHRLRALPLTWAVSFLLGLVLLGAQALIFFGTPESKDLLLLFGPWVLLFGLRLATLPGAFVPRHEYGEPPWIGVDKLGLAGILAVGAWLLYAVHTGDVRWESPTYYQGSVPPEWYSASTGTGMDLLRRLAGIADEEGITLLTTGALIAWVLCFHEGLVRARHRRSWRLASTAALFAALVLFAHGPTPFEQTLSWLLPGALIAGGCSFLASWVRRADRRSMMLSAAFFSGATLQGDLGLLAFPGLIPLVAFAAPGSRKKVLLGTAATFLALCLLPQVLRSGDTEDPVLPPDPQETLMTAVLFVALPLIVGTWVLFRWVRPRHERTDWNRAAAAVGSVLLAPLVGLLMTSGLLLVALALPLTSMDLMVLVVASCPVWSLFLGLALLPSWALQSTRLYPEVSGESRP